MTREEALRLVRWDRETRGECVCWDYSDEDAPCHCPARAPNDPEKMAEARWTLRRCRERGEA